MDPFHNSVVAELASTTDEIELFSILEGFIDYQLLDDDDYDNEKKREIIKKILTAVLSYHILLEKLPAAELAKNATYPTSLKLDDGSLDSEPLRLRVSSKVKLFHPTVNVNFYATITHPDVEAENGESRVPLLILEITHSHGLSSRHCPCPQPSSVPSSFYLPAFIRLPWQLLDTRKS